MIKVVHCHNCKGTGSKNYLEDCEVCKGVGTYRIVENNAIEKYKLMKINNPAIKMDGYFLNGLNLPPLPDKHN